MQIASTNTTQQLEFNNCYGALQFNFRVTPQYSISTSSTYGMVMPGRSIPSSSYRYGMNGQEKVDEVASGHYTAEYWEYDSRLARRWNLDPIPQVNISDYAAFRNNPISVVDPLGDKPTPKQAAQMSADVYNTANGKYKEGEKAGEIDGGWTLSSKNLGITLTDDKSGLNSAIYQRQTGTDKKGNAIFEYAYITQGSDFDNGGNDWSENYKQASGQFSQQYKTSTDNARTLSRTLGNAELSFAGHSLGGGLASANALATGRNAFTFNASGISDPSRAMYQLNRPANIQAYVVEGELVHSSQILLGLRAEGKITFLPASYIPTAPLIFAPPQVRTAATVINLGLKGYNHTMGSVLNKMKEQGIK